MTELFEPHLNGQEYSEYLVAFIDILGFKNIVEKSSKEKEYFNKILTATQIIEHVVMHNDEKKESEGRQVEMTQFSDSLVISLPYKNSGDLFSIIMDLDLVQKIIARDVGFIIRGGLTSGLLYHKGNISFGPAFVDAYLLESKRALYPRIIVDPKLLKPTDDVVENILVETFKKSNLAMDTDGYYFINFLGGYFSEPVAPEAAKNLKETAALELSNLSDDSETSESIRRKMEWILRYVGKCGY